MKKFYKITTVLVLLFVAFTVYAGDTGIEGFDAKTISLPTDGSGVYSVAGSRILGAGQPHFTLAADFSRHVISALRNARNIWLVDNAIRGDAMVGVGLLDFLSLGIDVPFITNESVKNAATATSYNEGAVGDIHMELKGRLLKDEGALPGIAIIPSIFIPSGDETLFAGEGTPRYQALFVIDKDLGPVYLSANAGYRFVNKKIVITTTINDQLLYGAGVRIPLPVWNRGLELWIEGVGSSVANNLSKNTTSLETLAGLRGHFGNGLSVNLGGGAGIIKSLGTPQFRILTSVAYTIPEK